MPEAAIRTHDELMRYELDKVDRSCEAGRDVHLDGAILPVPQECQGHAKSAQAVQLSGDNDERAAGRGLLPWGE